LIHLQDNGEKSSTSFSLKDEFALQDENPPCSPGRDHGEQSSLQSSLKVRSAPMISQSRDTGEQFTSGCDNGEQESPWGDHGKQVIIGSERQGEELVPPIPSHLENEVVDKPQVMAESSPTECPVSVVSALRILSIDHRA
jgi:hypothetical protein